MMRYVAGAALGVALTLTSQLTHALIPTLPVPLATTYHGTFTDEQGYEWDTDSGVVLAVPGLLCVGVEVVGSPGPFASLGQDC